MSESEPEDLGRKHQLHGVQPVLPVRDVAASAAFFRDALGFDVDFLHADPPTHARVKTGDGTWGQPVFVHLTQAEPAEIRPSGELRLHVGHDLDGLFAAYRARGVAVAFAPVSQPWGLREFAVRDPHGHVLRFCGETGAGELDWMASLPGQIRALEERLLDPQVRSDAGLLEQLLGDDFLEHGSSGRVYDKRETVALLATEPDTGARHAIARFRTIALAPHAVLASYRLTTTEREGAETHSLRSSTWLHRDGRWQLVFHQGTRAG